jgi:hypothetical protein
VPYPRHKTTSPTRCPRLSPWDWLSARPQDRADEPPQHAVGALAGWPCALLPAQARVPTGHPSPEPCAAPGWTRPGPGRRPNLSNARVEATNTHLRLLTRRACDYHSPDSLIAIADLTRGGLCPPLPGRTV